jgi:hypothetical protein
MYRLNSQVDRASDQGVLPHIAALAALRRVWPDTHLNLGLDIAWSDGRREEVDLFGYTSAYVLAGEVKTKAADFTEKQLQRDIDLSRRLSANVHVLAAMDVVPSSMSNHVSALCEASEMRSVVIGASAADGPLRVQATPNMPPPSGRSGDDAWDYAAEDG